MTPFSDVERAAILARLRTRSSGTHTPDGCWLWLGATVQGYGRLDVVHDGVKRKWRINRLVLVLDGRPCTEEQHACHVRHCTSQSCWNPKHLYPGTLEENVADRVAAMRRWTVLRCPKGHDKTGTGGRPYQRPDGSMTLMCLRCERQKQCRAALRRFKQWHGTSRPDYSPQPGGSMRP